MGTNTDRIWEIADLPVMGKAFLGNQNLDFWYWITT